MLFIKKVAINVRIILSHDFGRYPFYSLLFETELFMICDKVFLSSLKIKVDSRRVFLAFDRDHFSDFV